MAVWPQRLELVTPRERVGMFIAPGTKCKVTARYQVQISADKIVDCVRVHFYHGAGYTLHFADSEFKRLFKKYKEGR